MALTNNDVPEVRTVSESTFGRYKWRMLLAAMFCYLFFYTGRQAFGFAIPGIQEQFGWTKTTVGTISGIALWSYAIGQMVNGNLADKFGGRRLMSIGSVLSTVFNWVASFTVLPPLMATALGANGFVQAMGWSAGGRVISNWWDHTSGVRALVSTPWQQVWHRCWSSSPRRWWWTPSTSAGNGSSGFRCC